MAFSGLPSHLAGQQSQELFLSNMQAPAACYINIALRPALNVLPDTKAPRPIGGCYRDDLNPKWQDVPTKLAG